MELMKRNGAAAVYQMGEETLSCFENVKKDPRETELRLLAELLQNNKDTEYGRRYHFAEIDSFDAYKKNVPVTEYSDYEEFIDRMIKNGETGLISARPIIHYATSSGSTGKPKRIPVSDLGLQALSSYTTAAIAHLKRQMEEQHKTDGPWCILTDLYVKENTEGVTVGSISARAAYNFEEIINQNVTSPTFLQRPKEIIANALWLKALFALLHSDLSYFYATFSSIVYEFFRLIELEWKSLVNTIRTGELDESVSLSPKVKAEMEKFLRADPERADFLQVEFEKGFDSPIVPRIWPNAAMISCVNGSFFAEYSRRMKKYSGNIPVHALAYASSESIIAIPDSCNSSEYMFCLDKVFLEFLEVGKEDYSETVLADELEKGKDYEIILSNLSGFYRYRLLDVVRIDGHDGKMPYGHVVYRLNQVVNMVGEKTNTEQLEYVKEKLAERIGMRITAHSVYADYSVTPSRYILFFEPELDCGRGQQAQYEKYVDDIFREVNVSYEKYRHDGTLGEVEVMFVEPETYLLFKEMQISEGISANQIKPVLIISDEQKVNFFFGMAESPFKALQRNIFELKRKLAFLESV